MPWHIRYDVVWCGSTVDAWGEKGALLPPRDERRNANWDTHLPSESLDLRRYFRVATSATLKPCQVPNCKRQARVGRWCDWHARPTKGGPPR